MTYEMFRYVFLGGAIGCAVMVVVSVILFITLRIPKVIGDLTGRNARKAIEKIRKENEQIGDKSYKSSAVNKERGKLTEKITRSGRLIARDETPFGTGRVTEKISTQELPVVEQACETELLSPQTTLLTEPAGETEVLNVQQPVFSVEYEITFIHTTEVIS